MVESKLFYALKHSYRYFLLLLVLFLCTPAFSLLTPNQGTTEPTSEAKKFSHKADLFGTRVFVENKGQFDSMIVCPEKILYVLDNGPERVFFTAKGLIYELIKTYPVTEEQKEEMNNGGEVKLRENKVYRVNMNWAGANANPEIISNDKQSHYITYGEAKYNASTFKKLTYKNIYPGIDIEYVIPADKEVGIKYSYNVQAGADPSVIKMLYTGDVDKIKKNRDGEIVVKTPLDDIVEHVPFSFYGEQEPLASEFLLNGDTLGFAFPSGFQSNKSFTIDPWVTAVTTLSNNNYAYDVDYDFGGNTLIYGGNGSTTTGRYKVAKYNSTGTLLWTFSGVIVTPSWNSGTNWTCNFKVNKGTGKCYVSRNSVLPHVVRIDQNGNYDNWISSGTSVLEVWNMEFECNGDLIVYGGGNTSGEIVNSTTGIISLVTTFNPAITGCCQDVVSVAVDATGNTFVYFLGHTTLGNTISKLAPSFTNTIWNASSGFSGLSYLANKNNYVNASAGPAVAFNCLTVNQNYLYYYDGYSVAAYNKNSGSSIASTNTGLSVRQQGGIAVDDCDNVYVGGNGSVMCFHFNGTNFSTLTAIPLNTGGTYEYVYDVQLNRVTKVLYVSGSGFVGNYAAVHSNSCSPAPVQNPCNFGQGTITAISNSITCANLGSATVQAVGGSGPFSYTWIPTGQTGTTASGLSPGTYTVLVFDAGANVTLTNTATFLPNVPLSGNVVATGLSCFGDTNASASVTNLSGGSGNHSYLWSNGTNSYTTASINNLGAGNYTVSVTDALTGCVFTNSVAIIQPLAMNLLLGSSTATACTGDSIGLSAMNTGGSPGYTYTWTSGPAAPAWTVSALNPGAYTYTIQSTDNAGCFISSNITVTFVAHPVLSVPNVSICPLQTATLTANGATSYTWNTTTTGATYTDAPMTSTRYTVEGSSLGCNSIATASIVLKPVPVPTLTSNSPVCNGQSLALNASGGSSYVWLGPQSFSSFSQNTLVANASPLFSGVYQLTVTAANACTAATSATLTVNPTPTLSASGSTVCNNGQLNLFANSGAGSFYSWAGPNGFVSALQNPTMALPPVNASGYYTVTVYSPLTCTNTAQAHVTVTAKPVTNPTSDSPKCFGTALNLNGNNTQGAINYAWNGPAGFTSVLQNPSIASVNLNSAGIYSLTVTAGPCVTTNTTAVVINALPVFTATNTGPVCEGVKVYMSVMSASTQVLNAFVWTGPVNFNGYTNLVSRDSTQLSYTGIYTVLVTDNNNCQSQRTTTVTILQNPTVTAIGDTVCLYEPAKLKGYGGVTYKWYDANKFNFSSTPIADIPNANNKSITMYTVVGTAANGCTASAVAGVATYPLPQPSLSVAPSNDGCINSEFLFEGYGAVKYNWAGPNNFNNTNPTFTFVANSMAYSGVYVLTGFDIHNCKSSISTTIALNPLPVGELNGKPEDCAPFCSQYIFTPKSPVNPITEVIWKIDNRTIKGKDTITACFNVVGQYVIRGWMTDSKGCTNTTSLVITARPSPVADFNFTPVSPIENEDEVMFTNTSKGDKINQWTWSFAGAETGKVDYYSLKENTTYLFKYAGMYPVALVVKNTWGCSDTVVKAVKVEDNFNIYVPNAFTPNGDNKNDLFMPVFRGVKEFNISVYDRWGEKLYETNQFGTGWDGTYRGKNCKDDVYVWKMTVVSETGKTKYLNGEVLIYH